MITKSIERAQKKVEKNNSGKRLLGYDNVMNKQRNVVYKNRFIFYDLNLNQGNLKFTG